MEPLFENKYVCDRDLYKEYAKKASLTSGMIPILGLTYLIIIISLLVELNFYFLLPSWNFNIIQNLIVCVIVFFIFFSLSKISEKAKATDALLAHDMEINNGELIKRAIVVTCDKINVTGSSAGSNTGYSNHISYNGLAVKKVINSENLIILITQAKMGIIFKKDGFTKGTYEDFIFFLRDKGYRI